MKNWIGRRIIKTGFSVLITASICHILQLTPTFAVITAIVTIEPTAADSIKKGIIRLPAAAVGAIFAISADYILGQHALTYALVAMLTIIICSKLKFDTGTLVATLTAVAMIPGTTDHTLIDFVTRISGTSIGIFVSTFVNFLLLPPKFGPILVKKVDHLFEQAGKNLSLLSCSFFEDDVYDRMKPYHTLHKNLTEAYEVAHFQKDEWIYRKSTEFERRSFSFLHKKLDYLCLILFHLGKISHIHVNEQIEEVDKQLMLDCIQSFSSILYDPYHQITTHQLTYIEQIKQLQMKQNRYNNFTSLLCHELLSLHAVITDLSEITADERRFSLQEQNYPAYIFKKKLIYD